MGCAHYPKFSAPPSGETMLRRRTCFGDARKVRTSYLSPCQVWWGSDIARRQGAKKFDVLFFVFKWFFVCPSLRHEGVGVRKWSRYRLIGELLIEICTAAAPRRRKVDDDAAKNDLRHAANDCWKRNGDDESGSAWISNISPDLSKSHRSMWSWPEDGPGLWNCWPATSLVKPSLNPHHSSF